MLLVALVVFLALYNNAANLLGLPAAWYVPLNVALTAALLVAGRAAGLSWSRLGFDGASLGPGVRWGAGLVAAVAVGLALAAAVPALRPLFGDARVSGLSTGALLFTVLLRIPVGTALFEEVAFRGVLFGAWERAGGATAALVGTSALFGLWHIGPSIAALRVNDIDPASVAGVASVAGSVVVTALAGVGFCLLRLHTGGVLAPVLVHAGINSLSTLAARAVQSW